MKTKAILMVFSVIMLSCQNGNSKGQGDISGIERIKNAVKEYIVTEEKCSPDSIHGIYKIWESDTLSYELCLDALYSLVKLEDFLSPQLNSEINKMIKKVEREKPVFIKHIVPVKMKTEEHERGYVVFETNKGMRVIRLEEEKVKDGFVYWKIVEFDLKEEAPLLYEADIIMTKAVAYLKKEGYY